MKNSVEMGSDKAGDILSDAATETANVAEKVGRLAASATQSIKDLTAQFADGKVPSDADFAAARRSKRRSGTERNRHSRNTGRKYIQAHHHGSCCC